MNHLDLFSGIGGFSIALEKVGFKTVAFCEREPYCKLLLQKHWKGVKIYDDIKTIKGEDIEEPIDILTGGFPCQPYSVAGKQKGTDDDRYLWPEMFRVIKEVKPTFVIAENVRGIINIQDGMVFETVCSDLESEGFEVQPFNIPAAGVNAPHKRERVWIVGYSEHNGSLTSKIKRGNNKIDAGTKKGTNTTLEPERTSGRTNNEIMENTRRTLRQGSKFSEENENEIGKENANKFERSSSSRTYDVADSNTGNVETGRERQREIRENNKEEGQSNNVTSSSKVMANTKSEQGDTKHNGKESREVSEQEQSESRGSRSWTLREASWISEPDVGRVVNGVPGRTHRLKGLGNAIVPKIAEEIGKAIWTVLNQR